LTDYQPSNQANIVSQGTEIKEGDTNTRFQIQLLDVSGQPVDLTGSTVSIYFSNQSNSMLLLNKQASLSSTPTDGKVIFQFSENDATGNGIINIQVNVTYSDGDIEKFPANGYASIQITPSLDNLENVQLSTYTLKQVVDQLNTSFSTSLNSVKTELNSNINTSINEVSDKIGDLSQLPTTDKSSLVNSNKELSSQLAEMETQENHDADKEYMENMIQTAFSGMGEPKDTFEKLNVDYPTGDSKPHVVIADGNWYFWSSIASAWTSGGVYQSTQIANKGVPYYKLSSDAFANIKSISTYKKMDYAIQPGIYNLISGLYDPSLTDWHCLKVDVNPGDALRVSALVGGDSTALVIFYDGDDNIVGHLIQGPVSPSVKYRDYEFFVPDGAVSVAITGIFNDPLGGDLVLEKLQPYMAEKIQENEDAISDYIKLDYTVLPGIYNILNWGIYDSSYADWRSLKVNCAPGDKLRVTALVAGSSTALAIFFDATGAILSSIETGTSTNTQYIKYKFTVPDGAHFVAITGLASGGDPVLEKFQPVAVLEIEDKLSGYEQVNVDPIPGIENIINGGAYDSSVTDWKVIKTICAPGDKFSATAALAGDSTALVVFYRADGTMLSYLEQGSGIKQYTNYQFTVPESACFVAITGHINGGDPILKKYQPVAVGQKINDLSSKSSWSDGKTILWLGTSIPEGKQQPAYGYPDVIGKNLLCNMINNSIGASRIRRGIPSLISAQNPLGLGNMNDLRNLCQSVTEKQSIFDNWSAYKTVIPDAPETLQQSDIDFWLHCSYENLLDPYLTGTNKADLIVINHGYNDHLTGTDDVDTEPSDPYDRDNFIGAMNFIIERIKEKNPLVKIIIFGHYQVSGDYAKFDTVYQEIAKNWNIFYYPLWQYLGWSDNLISASQRVDASGNWVMISQTQMTIKNQWINDETHPQGAARDKIAEMALPFFKNIFN
jgi:hypothetical protein